MHRADEKDVSNRYSAGIKPVPKQDHMKRMDSQLELWTFCKKLATWKEESQRELSHIVDSHSSSIDTGINELMQEVCDLQAHLSLTLKEKNDLLEKVAKLSFENRELGAKLGSTQPLTGPEERNGQGTQGLSGPYVEFPDIKEEYTGSSDQDKGVDFGDISHQTGWKQDPLNAEIHVNDSTCIGLAEVVVNQPNDIEHEKEKETVLGSKRKSNQTYLKKTVSSVDHVCPECNLTFFTRYSLKSHLKNMHNIELADNHMKREKDSSSGSKTENKFSHKLQKGKKRYPEVDSKLKCEQCPYETTYRANMIRHNESIHTTRDKKFQCEKCPHSSAEKAALKCHIKAVHDKVRDHICEQCGFAVSLKKHLNAHIKRVHERIRKYVCEECGYAAVHKTRLKEHQRCVHNEGDKKFKCELCPYATSHASNFSTHVKRVHNKMRNHLCEECGYAASQKNELKKHMEDSHKME